MGEVGRTEIQMRDQTSRCGYHDVRPHSHPPTLLLPCHPVRTPVYGYSRYRHEVGKPFHLLIYLLRQFASGSHDHGIHHIGGKLACTQAIQYGEQIGCRLAGAGLGTSDHVATLQNGWDGCSLHRCGLDEIHGIETIQYFIS